jgi:phenylacetate-CoA ligase
MGGAAQFVGSGGAEPLPMRQRLYFAYHRAAGRQLGEIYRRVHEDDHRRWPPGIAEDGLRRILAHAGEQVPHYREALQGMGAEIEADPIAVLRSLPILTRESLRAAGESLQSEDIAERGATEQTSGGSTGEPVRIMQDTHFEDVELAVSMLQSSWTGWRFGQPEVWIWGSERDIIEGQAGLRERLGSRLTGRRYVNAFKLTPAAMHELLAFLNRERPPLIVSYAHTLGDLASFVESEAIPLAPQRAIISTASTLHPVVRERVDRVFGCRVFDQYGSREVGDIACQCGASQGFHVLPWTNYVEIVDEAGQPVEPGGEGRVIVTSLCNYTMPLLRYEVGDRARLVPADEPPCPCGRPGLRLAEVLGRIGDTFKGLDGSRVASGYFIHMLFFHDFVKEFQVVQTAPERVVYRLVATRQPDSAELEEIAANTRMAMGEGCAVEFEFEDEIPVTASGKRRYTICEC